MPIYYSRGQSMLAMMKAKREVRDKQAAIEAMWLLLRGMVP